MERDVNGSMQARRNGRAPKTLLLVTAFLLAAACSNLISGDDLKTAINGEVTTANAESVPVTISANPTSGGALSISGQATEKVGIPFSLTASAYDKYAFSGWTATGSGNVSFGSASTGTTKVTVQKSASDVAIIANFVARPEVKSVYPTNQKDDVVRNQPITVIFSKTMKPASFEVAGNIVVKSFNTDGSNEAVLFASGTPSSYFDFSVNSGSNGFVLTPKSSYMPSYHNIYVIISSAVTDSDGNKMAEDYDNYYFTTNNEKDTNAPILDSYAIYTGSGLTEAALQIPNGALKDYFAIKTKTITLHTVYSYPTSASTAKNITITETGMSNGVEETKTNSGDTGYDSDYAYSLQTSDQGEKTLEFSVFGDNKQATTQKVHLYYDTKAPSVTALKLSASGSSTAYARLGDTISLAIAGSEAIHTVALTTTNGASVNKDAAGSDNPTIEYTVGNSSTEGAVGYKVTLTDYAGNSTTVDSSSPGTVTLSGGVTIDKTAPMVTFAGITTSNGNKSYAKSGDTITLEFTASDTLSGIASEAVTIAGHAVTPALASGVYTATYDMTGTDAEGKISYSINATDGAGNASTNASVESTLVYDRSAPTVTFTGITTSNGNKSYAKSGDKITLEFTASDTLSGIASEAVTIAGHAVTPALASGVYTATYDMTDTDAEGKISYSINAADILGNASTNVSVESTLVYDRSAPTVTLTSIGTSNSDSGYAKSGDKITLEFTASDGTGSGVGLASATIAGHTVTPTPVNGVYKATYDMTDKDAEGKIGYSINATDILGNASMNPVVESAIVYDRSAPTVTFTGITTSNGNKSYAKTGDTITLEFTASDTLSGIASEAVTIAGHAVTPALASGVYTATYDMTGTDAEGKISYSINATDGAGNASAEVSSVESGIAYDRTAPDVSGVTINDGAEYATSAGMTTKFKVEDDRSGVVAYSVGETVGNYDWKPIVSTKSEAESVSYTLIGGEGLRTAYVYAKDAAGNISAVGSDAITQDTKAPTVTAIALSTTDSKAYVKSGDKISLAITGSDSTSKLKTVSLTIAGETVSKEVGGIDNPGIEYTVSDSSTEGPVGYTVTLTDNAGNSTTVDSSSPGTVTTSGSTIIDTKAPEVVINAIKGPVNEGYAKKGDVIRLNFKATDVNLSANASVTIAGTTTGPEVTSGAAQDVTYMVTDATSEGTVAYSVTATDKAGNSSPAVTVATSGSVIVDRTAPVVVIHTIKGSVHDNYAKKDEAIRLNFTATDTNLSANASVTIAGTTTGPEVTSGTAQDVIYTVDSNTSEGMVTYSVTATDKAGNSSPAVTVATSGSVIVDRTAPEVVINRIKGSANDSYAKEGDAITLNFTATDVNLSANASVTIAGTTTTPEVTSGTAQDVTYTVTKDTAEGTVAYSVMATDKAGNSSPAVIAATSGSVVVDKTGPEVIFTAFESDSKTNAAYAKEGDKVTLSFTLSDPNAGGAKGSGASGIASVALGVSGTEATSITRDASSGVYTATYTVPAGSTGPVTYSIIAKDALGNTTTVGTLGTTSGATVGEVTKTVTMDTAAPTMKLTFSDADNLVKAGSYTYTATFTDANDIDTTTPPKITIGSMVSGASMAEGANSKVWTYSFVVPDHASTAYDGSNPLSVSVSGTDMAGNANTTTADSVTSVTVDNTAPVVVINTIKGSANDSYAKEGDAITLNFTATDVNLSANASVTIAGTTTTPEVTSGTAQDVTYTVTKDTAEGTVAYSVMATDKAGNSSPAVIAATSGSVVVDKTGPEVIFTAFESDSKTNAAYAKEGDKVTLSFTLSDPNAGGAKGSGASGIASVALGVSGTEATSITRDASSGVYTATYTVPAGSTGPVTYSIIAKDALGNTTTVGTLGTTSGATVGEVTKTVTMDTAAPTMKLTFSDADNLVKAGSYTYTATFTDANDIDTTTPPKITIGSMVSGASMAEGANSKVWTYSFVVPDHASTAYDGSNPLSVSVSGTDMAGNANTTTADSVTSVTVDNTAPVVVINTIKGSANDSYAKEGDAITLNFTATDVNLSENASATIAGTTTTVTSGTAKDAIYTVTEGTAEGTVAYSVTATDKAGNSSLAVTVATSGSVVVDRTVPTVSDAAASFASTVSLTYTTSETSLSEIDYWLSSTSKPISFYTIKNSLASPVSLSQLSSLVDLTNSNGFGFCLVDAAGNESPSYLFTYSDSAFGDLASKSLSGRSTAIVLGKLSVRNGSAAASQGLAPLVTSRASSLDFGTAENIERAAAQAMTGGESASEPLFTPSAFDSSSSSSGTTASSSSRNLAKTVSYDPSSFFSFFPTAKSPSRSADTSAETERKTETSADSALPASRVSQTDEARPFGVSVADFEASTLGWLFSSGAQTQSSPSSPKRSVPKSTGAEWECLAYLPAAHSLREGGSDDDEGAGADDSGDLE